MAHNYFSDLHCHPSMIPIMLSKETFWDTHRKKRHRATIRKQKKGLRGAIYAQSGYPKLINGNVKIVFVVLYPLEQGFMVNNNEVISIINIAARALTLGISKLNIFGKKGHFRDYPMSLFTNFLPKKIRELRAKEYWVSFTEEVNNFYSENNSIPLKLTPHNLKEIRDVKRHFYSDDEWDGSLIEYGTYQIVDGKWDEKIPDAGKVLTVLTIEGVGALSQTKKGATNSKHGTVLDGMSKIMKRIAEIKALPVLYLTFSHHFSSSLCGHARSFPNKARFWGALNQEHFINEPFTRQGYKILQHLLAVKLENGKWIRDNDAGRRIFIDVKHMSIRGRLSLYQLINGYNEHNPDDKIPVIASHIGFSNRTISQLLQNSKTGKEVDSTQCEEEMINGRLHHFNTWSINLGSEEVGIIVKSGGLIGISLEQNNHGVKFGKRVQRKAYEFYPQLVFNQILSMARAANDPNFWDCITIGTDFDGLIDPVNKYSSALLFMKLKNDLRQELRNISSEERSEACMDHLNNEKILEKLFFDNASDFLKRHSENLRSKNLPQ